MSFVKSVCLFLSIPEYSKGIRLKKHRELCTRAPLLPIDTVPAESLKSSQSTTYWISEEGYRSSPWWTDSNSSKRFQIFSDKYMHGEFPAYVAVPGKVNDVPSLHFLDVRLPEDRQSWAKAAVIFNQNPKMIKNEEFQASIAQDGKSSEESLADFLMLSPTVDRIQSGEFLSSSLDISRRVLRLVLRKIAEIKSFQNQPVVDSMRHVFAYFKPGGEGQAIDRVVEAFAEVYWSVQPSSEDNDNIRYVRNSNASAESSVALHGQDTVHVLAYSILMLNTDLHSVNIKTKMTTDQFIKNNRGIDDGHDLPESFLRDIYDSLSAREIILDIAASSGGTEMFILRCRRYSKICKVLPPGAQDKHSALLRTSQGYMGGPLNVACVADKRFEKCAAYCDGTHVFPCSGSLPLATLHESRIIVQPSIDAGIVLVIKLILTPNGYPMQAQLEDSSTM